MLAEKYLEKEIDYDLIQNYINNINDPNFETMYNFYQLTDDKSHLKIAYEDLINQSQHIEENFKSKFLSYPLNNQIIQDYKKYFKSSI